MSRTGVECRVLIDGARLDDGCVDWTTDPSNVVLPRGVYADDGLRVTWGRSSSTDQPESSTCTFRVLDGTGTAAYAESIKIGARVDVYADAEHGGGDPVPAFTDGGFEEGVNAAGTNVVISQSTRHVLQGSYSARAEAADGGAGLAAQFAPGPLQPDGQNPAAWAALPVVHGVDPWHFALDVWTPIGLAIIVRPVLYRGPWASSAVVQAPSIPVGPSVDGWAHVEGDWTPTPDAEGFYVGVHVETALGLLWDSAPGTWNDWKATRADVAWNDLAAVHLDDVHLLAPPAATGTALVFSGRISDLEVAYDDDRGETAVGVTAVDFLADLANRFVGAEPWPVEPLEARVDRILAAVTVGGETIVADVAPTVAAVPVSYMDVDRQAAAALLSDLSQSVDGVLWSAADDGVGPYLRLEDPAARVAMYRLEFVDGVIVIVPTDFSTADPELRPLELSACDLLRDPVTFVVDVSDVASRVAVDWLEQGVDDEGKPTTTDRRDVVVDPNREAAFGSRSVSVSTVLTTGAAASNVATRILTRTGGDWRVAGLVVDDADFAVPNAVAARALMRLLDGVERGGLPVQVTDMPDWNPIADPLPAYVEGGEYTFADGGWALALIVSRATGLGRSVTWNGVDPAWIWDHWAPDLTWNDLRGVAGPAALAETEP